MKSMIKSSEHQIQAAFFQQINIDPKLKKYSPAIFAIPNAAKRTYALASYSKAEGLKSGVWDIFVAVPSGNSHGLWIEFKSGYNKLTPNQLEFRQNVIQFGYEFVVCYSTEEAISKLKSYIDVF